MVGTEKVKVYDSKSTAYHDAFEVFLNHTDQKVKARAWLDALAGSLRSRNVFVDAGAGNGQVTAWLTDRFDRTIAIEPNPSLAADLRRACPRAEVLPESILDAQPKHHGDLILCSHVLYYIPQNEWLLTVVRMASWLAPTGVLVLILQNHETDCMRMLEAFHGSRFDLRALAEEFETKHGSDFLVERQLVPARITCPDLKTAYVIAEFMLNLLPIPNPPARSALEDYARKNFGVKGGKFQFSCDQDFVVIRRRS